METDSQTQKSRGNKNTVAVSSETPLSSSAIISLSPVEAMELLLSKIKKTKNNSEFLASMVSGKS